MADLSAPEASIGGNQATNAQTIKVLAEEFASCKDILIALGDENRVFLLTELMQMGSCKGVCVGDITARTHLSRPAVSHHLQILKNVGVLGVRKEGTKNYYYFESDQAAMKRLVNALQSAICIAGDLPEVRLRTTC